MLTQVDISEDLIGQTYGELFARLTLTQHLIPLGLYRRCASRSADSSPCSLQALQNAAHCQASRSKTCKISLSGIFRTASRCISTCSYTVDIFGTVSQEE